jgi:Kef-type K+ transport system membrane component KefB
MQRLILVAGLLLLIAGVAWSAPSSASSDSLTSLVLLLAIVVAAAKLGGELATRLNQPAVLGELIVGALLGSLPLARTLGIDSNTHLDMLSRLGMLLLMFEVGLDLSVRDLFAVGPSSLLVATFGSTASLLIGWLAATWLLPGAGTATHVFIGAALSATSVGITARVLKDLRQSRSVTAGIILGAAVVDDIIALVVLALMTGWIGASPGSLASTWSSAAVLVAKSLGFIIVALVLGVQLTPKWFSRAAQWQAPGTLLALGLVLCFSFAWASSALGLAPLVGAFAAGLILEDFHSDPFVERGERRLQDVVPTYGLLRIHSPSASRLG